MRSVARGTFFCMLDNRFRNLNRYYVRSLSHDPMARPSHRVTKIYMLPLIIIFREITNTDEPMKKYLDDIKDGLSKIKPTVWDNMQRKVSILISTTSTVADFHVILFSQVES